MHFLTSLINNPFFLKAALAGIFAGALLASLGVFAVLRNLAFFSDGLAHTALTGLALGIVLNQEPLLWAMIFAVLFAIIIYFLERKTTLLPDTLISILFTASLALGIVLLRLKSGGDPESLEGLLFGDLESIRRQDVFVIIAASLPLMAFVFWNFKKYVFMSLNKELAYVSGVKTELLQLCLYIILALAIILGIKLLGTILVSSLLIVPVATAKLFAKSTTSLLILGLIFSVFSILLGLSAAALWSLPAGAMIVLSGTALFILGLLLKR